MTAQTRGQTARQQNAVASSSSSSTRSNPTPSPIETEFESISSQSDNEPEKPVIQSRKGKEKMTRPKILYPSPPPSATTPIIPYPDIRPVTIPSPPGVWTPLPTPSQRAIRFYQVIMSITDDSEDYPVPIHLFCDLETERVAMTLMAINGADPANSPFGFLGSDYWAAIPNKQAWQDARSRLVFAFCIANIPPCGKGQMRFQGEWMGRDELIGKIVEIAMGDSYYHRKTVSSHTQVLSNKFFGQQMWPLLKTHSKVHQMDGKQILLEFNDDIRVFLGVDAAFDLWENKVPQPPRVYCPPPELDANGKPIRASRTKNAGAEVPKSTKRKASEPEDERSSSKRARNHTR
ncbi:hypothetical protein M231_02555 [Tremella mesenterica]|uniref:TEA domain-containing protein n=1 Tax=Tremella mesenterica TaxID=5217 RepID=A0A4Q1BQ95_TREME|nr:hypothetical protein M231_02555 [Tremella mesenterica]